MKPESNRFIFKYIALATLGLLITISYQNCAVQKPGVQNMSYASVNYSHSGMETSCSSCHEKSRPMTSAGFLGLDTTRPFDYATHGAGLDCISCHIGGGAGFKTQADWSGASFTHSAMTTTCLNCHSSQRPGNSTADLAKTGGFDHVTAGQGECFGCHSAAMNSTFTSMSDWGGAVGVPSILRWDIARDITASTKLPIFANTTITSLTSQSQVIHMAMSHSSSQVSSAVMSQCSQCHTGASYAGGSFHASVSAQPSKCNDCHNSSALPVGFIGPTDGKRSPTSASMRHEAVAWLVNASGLFMASSSPLVGADCAACHTAPTSASTAGGGTGSSRWANAQYHNSLTSAAIAQPSSCLDCHANSRSIGSSTGTLTAFDHSLDTKGMGDCNACHAVGSSWANGVFHKGGVAPTSCNTCHASQRPQGTTVLASNGTSTNFIGYSATVKPFDISPAQNASGYHGGTKDCAVCHSATQYASMSGWSGGVFHNSTNNASVTSCSQCHESQRPASAIMASAANGLATGSSFNHATDGQGDCIACHKATITAGVYAKYNTANPTSWGDTDWKGAVTYDPVGLMGPDPTMALTTVATIHLNYANLANFVVGSKTNVTQTLKDQMKHTSNQVPASFWQSGIVGSSLDTTKCSGCHMSLPTKYAPGKFHAAAGGPVATGALTSCRDCHVNTVPTDIAFATSDNGTQKLKPMDHAALLSSGLTANNALDCASCHTAATAGANFSGASFHSKLGALSAQTCTACHATTSPATALTDATRNSAGNIANFGSESFSHTSSIVTGDCSACHAMTNATIAGKAAATASWSGGLFHKFQSPTAITSCSDCHTAKPTTAPTVSSNDSQHMNHTSTFVSANCYQCHKNDLVAGATPTTASWSKSDLFHVAGSTSTVAGGTVSSCQECHGLSNGGGSVAGTNNDIPAALTTSSFLSSYPTTNATSKVLYDQVIHTDINIAGKDCNTCHSSNANIGMAGTKWKGAGFHANSTALNASTSCLSCHSNILAYIRANGNIANGQDHSTTGIGTQDCKTCHTFPGTGVIGSATNPPNWLGAAGGIPATVTLLPPTGTTRTAITVAHPALGTNVTCVSCHGATVTSKVVGMDHTALTTGMACVYCHYTSQQNVLTASIPSGAWSGKGLHSGDGFNNAGTQDCKDCHYVGSSKVSGFAFPTKSTTNPATWNTGGRWKN